MAPTLLLSPPPCYSQANASLNTRWVCPGNFTRGDGGGRSQGEKGDGTGGCLSTTLQRTLLERLKERGEDGRPKLGTVVLTGPCEPVKGKNLEEMD